MNYENHSTLTANNLNENNMDSYTRPLIVNSHAPNNGLRLWRSFQRTIGNQLTKVKKESAVLFWSAIIMVFFFIVSLAGLLIDDRTLLGVNVWIKPLKFSISIGVYLLTVGFLVTKYPYSIRKRNIINHLTSWMLVIEMGIIALQAYRGVQSHYNIGTPLDSILFMVMGILTGTLVLIMLLFIIDTIRLKLKTSKAMQWAILMGWLVVFFGSWVGGQMIAQMGHNIGVADGGSGLALVNWSTIGGDLRVAHFFGLHGIQIIPFFAFWLSKKWRSSNRKQIIIVTLFALTYASWLGFTFYQAKQGMALLGQ